jgi:hypothetical protein
MKSGKVKFVIAAGFLCGVIVSSHNARKAIHRLNREPTLGQYMNRFREFYDKNDLHYVYSDFFTLINDGFSPQRAFDSILEKVLN